MSEEIIKVLDNLAQRFGIAIDWTNQYVMPYIQELMGRFIVYKNAQAIMWIIISIVVIIGSIIVCKKLRRDEVENNIDEYDDEAVYVAFGYIGTAIAISGFLIALLCNIDGLIQNICIPEITILNYITSLM